MLNLSGIVSDSIVDGPGIRVTVFCQGCPHHCPGCHNPETWPFEGGTEIAEETVVSIVASNPLCRGVTFSGGEPFAQAEGYAKLAKLLKEKGYTLKNAMAADLFPRCAHVESVVCLSREKADDYIRISVHTEDLKAKAN